MRGCRKLSGECSEEIAGGGWSMQGGCRKVACTSQMVWNKRAGLPIARTRTRAAVHIRSRRKEPEWWRQDAAGDRVQHPSSGLYAAVDRVLLRVSGAL